MDEIRVPILNYSWDKEAHLFVKPGRLHIHARCRETRLLKLAIGDLAALREGRQEVGDFVFVVNKDRKVYIYDPYRDGDQEHWHLTIVGYQELVKAARKALEALQSRPSGKRSKLPKSSLPSSLEQAKLGMPMGKKNRGSKG